MDFNWEKLQKLLGTIGKYAIGKLVPANIGVLKKHSAELARYMADLTEWDIYQTAGAYQDKVKQKLRECKDARLKLDSLISWYKEVEGNGKFAKWRRGFLEVGTGKNEESFGTKLKLIRGKGR